MAEGEPQAAPPAGVGAKTDEGLEGHPIVKRLRERFPEAVMGVSCLGNKPDELTLLIKLEMIAEVCRFLKAEPGLQFNFLSDLCGVDYPQRPERFEVVYHLYSLTRNQRVRIKVRLEEDEPEVASAMPLWGIANWYEREVWDMFGIRFRGHPNPKRLLMYEEFEGHPLRKDYPVNKRQPLIGPKI